MSELALARRLARTRRRKPRPPMWWICVILIALTISASVFDLLSGQWLFAGNQVCLMVLWWRHLHSPPYYYDPAAPYRWLPPAILFLFAGAVTAL